MHPLKVKEIITCLFLSLSFLKAYSQIEELNGKVKSLYESEYYAKDSAGVAVRDGNPYSWAHYTFNKAGQVLVETNNHAGNGFIKKEVYKYDNKGREVENDSYITDTINYPSASFTKYKRGKIVEQDTYPRYIHGWSETHPYYANKTRYTLTLFGKTKKEIFIQFSERGDSTVNLYDYNSRFIKVKENKIDTIWSGDVFYTIRYYYKGKDTCEVRVCSGKITQRTLNKYNRNGLLVEKNTIGVTDKSLNCKEVFKYYKSTKRQIEYIRYANDTIPNAKISYKYNANGKILLYESFNYDKGKLTEYRKQVYEYDDRGNMVKTVNYDNESPITIIERRISYY